MHYRFNAVKFEILAEIGPNAQMQRPYFEIFPVIQMNHLYNYFQLVELHQIPTTNFDRFNNLTLYPYIEIESIGNVFRYKK